MKSVPRYQATFQQPRGPLNKLDVRVTQPVRVEIFRKAGKWRARNADSKADLPAMGVYAEEAKKRIGELFVVQLTRWKEIDPAPSTPTPPPYQAMQDCMFEDPTPARPVDADEIQKKTGKARTVARKHGKWQRTLSTP